MATALAVAKLGNAPEGCQFIIFEFPPAPEERAPHSQDASTEAAAGSERRAATAAGRLQGGRKGVLHGAQRDLCGRRQGRARPAGRGDGACHSRGGQGQGRERALPRQQQGRRRLPPHHGPPPPRRLRCHPPPAPLHATLPTSHAFPRQPLPRRPSPHCMRSRSHRSPRMDAGGTVAEGVVQGETASVAAPERVAAEPYTSLLLTAGDCVRR